MKPQKRTMIVFLLILSLSFSLLSPVAVSSGEQNTQNTESPGYNDGDQPGEYNQNEAGQIRPGGQGDTSSPKYRYRHQIREMTIEGDGTNTRIRSQYREEDHEQTAEFLFSIDTAPTFQLSFLGNTTEPISHQHFRLIVEQLIEYIDSNENGRYDANDIIISVIDLSNVTFANITYSNITTPDGGTITIIKTHTVDTLFSVTIYVADTTTSFLNTTITPKEIKFDFGILNYPFMNQESHVALLTFVETPYVLTAQQRNYGEEPTRPVQEGILNVSSTSHSGFFSWEHGTIVDGVPKPVNATIISKTEQTFQDDSHTTSTQAQVIFSYARGESILHDPKIGVIPVLGAIVPPIIQVEYLSVIYLLACLISGVVFYGIIYYRKKF